MEFARKFLFYLSDQLETGVSKLRGAADRISPNLSLTQSDCESENWQNVRPCFVLSTGRTGTLLLTRLLRLSPQAFPLHQPRPELIRASGRAYEQISQSPEIYREVFKCAREELLLEAARRNKVYIETNNRITFFAPIIRDVFPNAVFIHLVRHPGDFVRSGIRRGWYSGKHDHDIGRIIPLEDKLKTRWDNFSMIEKIGWLWNETNQFIEDFKGKTLSGNFMSVKAEELFFQPEITKEIFSFLNLRGPNVKSVRRIIAIPVNKQRRGDFQKYKDWSTEEKDELRNVAPLMEKYGYD